TADRDAVTSRIANYGMITSVDHSADAIVARMADGMRCEIHRATRGQFGWALICATGSPEHVEQLRARADARGVVLNTLAAPDEVDVYRALGLPLLPPEVRDGIDELAAADAGDDFSDLVTLADVTTAFHCHTTYSDGKDSIEDMARAAAALGMQAITITDHSAAATYAGGLDADALRRQH